ncbi:MAG TPA: Asp-tRNA(Asn)/Glu-tRNA(Gln) amidotransferase subunit GatC [Clostridiaceae bacterium]|nr:Asp-tRNA(Asn)/Glu-tRNA(Gln) amidotransferase subunit GatC [Clostridiaceae bacterium]
MDMQTVSKYEAMVKLDLPESERIWIAEKVSMLEDSFSKLSKVDTEGVEPLISVVTHDYSLREDIPVKLVSRDEILSNSPEQFDGYFLVPKTIE